MSHDVQGILLDVEQNIGGRRVRETRTVDHHGRVFAGGRRVVVRLRGGTCRQDAVVALPELGPRVTRNGGHEVLEVGLEIGIGKGGCVERPREGALAADGSLDTFPDLAFAGWTIFVNGEWEGGEGGDGRRRGPDGLGLVDHRRRGP